MNTSSGHSSTGKPSLLGTDDVTAEVQALSLSVPLLCEAEILGMVLVCLKTGAYDGASLTASSRQCIGEEDWNPGRCKQPEVIARAYTSTNSCQMASVVGRLVPYNYNRRRKKRYVAMQDLYGGR